MKNKKKREKTSATNSDASGKSKMRRSSQAQIRKIRDSIQSGYVIYGETADGCLVALCVIGAVVITPSQGISDGRGVVLAWRKRKAYASKLSEMLNEKARHEIPQDDALAMLQQHLFPPRSKPTSGPRPSPSHKVRT